MTALAAVVIPWYPSTRCVWRERWLTVVRSYWEASGLGVVVPGVGEEGAARNRGVRLAADRGCDTFLVADADSLIPVARARAALEAAAAEPGLVVPHDRCVYLSRTDSARHGVAALDLLGPDGRVPDALLPAAEWYGPGSVGGPVAFSLATFEAAGGYDERIVHGHDGCFALACCTLAGPGSRLTGDMLHLWHPRPPAAVLDPPDTWATLSAYHAAAASGPEAMRALVTERAALAGVRSPAASGGASGRPGTSERPPGG